VRSAPSARESTNSGARVLAFFADMLRYDSIKPASRGLLGNDASMRREKNLDTPMIGFRRSRHDRDGLCSIQVLFCT
jgi:hypothetical protein